MIKGAQGLALPILTSTLTTIAAFLPMLTIVGNVGEYVSSLPVVVAATLAVSYFVAMLVTPIMCVWLLKVDAPEKSTSSRAALWQERYDTGIGWCLQRPGKVVAGATLAALSVLRIQDSLGHHGLVIARSPDWVPATLYLSS